MCEEPIMKETLMNSIRLVQSAMKEPGCASYMGATWMKACVVVRESDGCLYLRLISFDPCHGCGSTVVFERRLRKDFIFVILTAMKFLRM